MGPVEWEGDGCIGRACFPQPQGININMMPFVMGQKDSIPEKYQHYWPLIEQCAIPRSEQGKVCYLTIQESQVPAGQPQRRGGVHIESPGTFRQPGEYQSYRRNWGCGAIIMDETEVEGGIYMASNVG